MQRIVTERLPHDRSNWRAGPWDAEPDKIQWQDEATGLPCLIVRNYFGALCGYVGVSKGHPAYGESYSDLEVTVHGGLTYAARCVGEVCHVVDPEEDDDVWWLGFDCAHCTDKAPSSLPGLLGGVYRNIAYVEGQCAALAAQLQAQAHA